MGIAIPRDLGWASGMAAVKKGRMARIKECEKYMIDWKRSRRLQMSGRGQKALGSYVGYVRCFYRCGVVCINECATPRSRHAREDI
jgi:hypothetical protein